MEILIPGDARVERVAIAACHSAGGASRRIIVTAESV